MVVETFYRAVDNCTKKERFMAISGLFNVFSRRKNLRVTRLPKVERLAHVRGAVLLMRGGIALQHNAGEYSHLEARNGRDKSSTLFFPQRKPASPGNYSAFAHVVLLDEEEPPKLLLTCMQKVMIPRKSTREGRIVHADPNQNLGARRHVDFISFAQKIADEMARLGTPVQVLLPHPTSVQIEGVTHETREKIQEPFRARAETHETQRVAFGDYSLKVVNLSRPKE